VFLRGKDSLKTANKAAVQLEADVQSRFSGVRKKMSKRSRNILSVHEYFVRRISKYLKYKHVFITLCPYNYNRGTVDIRILMQYIENKN
jgi:hypothetical protein